MYVNIENLYKLDIKHLPIFLLLYQASKKDMSKMLENLGFEDTVYADLQVNGYITYIKGTKKQSLFQKMRPR